MSSTKPTNKINHSLDNIYQALDVSFEEIHKVVDECFSEHDDSTSQTIEKIVDSFKFINKYCKDNKTDFNKYISLKDSNNQFHNFLIHLKNRDIIIYTLFTFPNFDKTLNTYEREIKDFVFGDALKDLNFYRTRYHCSTKAKKLCILLFEKLNSKLTNI